MDCSNCDKLRMSMAELIVEYNKTKKEKDKLKEAEKMLFQIFNTIGFCQRIENSLPDSFDDQLCDGIANYFNAI